MRNNIISLEDKKKVIADFLIKCNAYSDQMVSKYEARKADCSEAELAALEQKVHDWGSYKAFNAYTIDELAGEVLDEWF